MKKKTYKKYINNEKNTKFICTKAGQTITFIFRLRNAVKNSSLCDLVYILSVKRSLLANKLEFSFRQQEMEISSK